MAHQNGTATDPVDLLDKLRIFAQANGFTIHNFGARPAGTSTAGQALQLSKGGIAASFLSRTYAGTSTTPGQFIGGYAHDAYTSGGGTENQANGSPKVEANALTGPYQGYDFFSDDGTTPPYLYVVVETAAGEFKHFGMGKLESFGQLNTGAFFYACQWDYGTDDIDIFWDRDHSIPFDSYENSAARISLTVRADSDTISPRWYTPVGSTDSLRGGFRVTSGAASQVRLPMLSSASQLTGRTPLTPCLITGSRTGGLYSPLGMPPNMRWVALDYLDPGAVLAIGTDQWKVFPVIRKNGGPGQPNSERFGYAFKMT